MALTIPERKKRLAITGAAGLVMVALIVLLVNVLGNWAFFRLDLTQQKAYSLSSSSKRLVRELTDPLIVKVFFTPDLPPPYNAYERYLRDLLEEYRAASHGKVRYEFAPQSPPAEFEKKAAAAGLMPIQFEQMGTDQVQIRRGYMGLVLFHRDKSETLPIVKDVQQLEYDLTSRIARLAVRTKKTIAVASGHGELSWLAGQTKLSQDMSELYTIKEVALPAAATSFPQADVLLVVGPKQKFDEKSLWAIDQMIMRGTPAAFLLDSENLMVSRFMVTSLDTGLNDLLKSYGAQLGDRLIYDAECETIGVTQNVAGYAYQTSLRYPYIPLIDRLSASHPLTRGIDTVGLPFVCTVDPVQPLPGTIHFSPLFFTSPKSWLAPAEPYASVAPNHIPVPDPNQPHGPFMVGGLLEGMFTSYFLGKAIPIPGQSLIGTSPRNQIFVLGTSRLLDPALPQLTGGDALVSNLLAYLSKDETLIGIRSKGEIIRPLKLVPHAVREIVKYGSVLGVAMLPALLGLWRWRIRQQWRQAISAAYAPKAGA